MDIHFLAKLKEAGPTQYEQGRNFCISLMETVDRLTGRPVSPMRVEETIVAMLSVTIQMCVDGGYEPFGVMAMLIEAYDRAPSTGPRKPMEDA